MPVDTPHLDLIEWPHDLRGMSVRELKLLADELRAETIDAVSHTGGHLGAGIGVVELTTALHYLFNTPEDILIWDVGHQCYPHKILTGRRSRIRTLRQGGGLSGFTKRSESEYDPFGAAHASTSISSALGFAVSRDLQGRKNRVVAVIGDGALTGGMAYEGLNNAGSMDTRLIVVLNDNEMSIAPPVGAMSGYLSRLISSKRYRSIRDIARHAAERFPRVVEHGVKRAEKYARGLVTGGTPVRGAGLLLRGAHRRPQPRPSPAHPPQRARRRGGGSHPGPRLHQEGEGLRAGGRVLGPVTTGCPASMSTPGRRRRPAPTPPPSPRCSPRA